MFRLKYLCVIIFTWLCSASHAQHLIIGTFNLRYDNAGDTGNRWKDRAPIVTSLIAFHGFDILGTQEGLKNQLDDISNALPEYDHYGVGRDDGKDAGEHSAIFYRKGRFTLQDKGDFWLSATPNKPTLGWDARCCKRICSWVKLKDKQTGKILWVFNAHYDHEGQVARAESSKLVLQKIKTIAGKDRVLFMGDLNGGHSSEPYKIIATSGLLSDTYTRVAHPYANNPSFQAFGRQLGGSEIIDHIFVTHQFTALRWGILSDCYHGKYPSDHFPVLAEVEY
jgi:endonuclease/exonuclease/phosphatase family metal-dependent hydrolase